MRAAFGWTAAIDRSLGARLIATLTGVGILGSIAITLLLALVITPHFDRLETEYAAAQRARLASAMNELADRTVIEAWSRSAPSGAPPTVAWRGVGFARIGGRIALVARHDGVVVRRWIDPVRMSEVLDMRITLVPHTGGDPSPVRRTSGRLLVDLPLADAKGRPVADLRITLPRDLSTLGQRMLGLAVAGSTLLLLIVLVVLRRSVISTVLQPLGRLEAHMLSVRASGRMHPFDDAPRRDEIGSLATGFNAMLAQLAGLRAQLEAQSYRLGQSESAVAVVHNVRNALNPVSTILSQGLSRSSPVDAAIVRRALAELATDGLPSARRRKLTAFVAAAMAHEEEARRDWSSQLEVARDAMRHALAIVGRQQADALARPHLAPCDIVELFAQNASIARLPDGRSVSLDLPDAPAWVVGNRVVLSQVIGNLIANAVESIAARGGAGGSIAVRIAAGNPIVATVTDNGEGFDPEVGRRLFQRGYSTRRDKAGGFGLHWCANAMNAMGGGLSIESDGVGRGATARLVLPAAPTADLQDRTADARDAA